jgi:ABC-type glycerol-3-phosphate transport system substrate-binding protein
MEAFMKGFKVLIMFIMIFSLICTFSTFSAAKKVTNLFLMHDKVGNPDFQPYFLKTAKVAQQKIGLTFTPVGYPTTDVYQAAIKASLPTAKAPNIFTWWSTYWAKGLADEGLLEDMTPLWDKHKSEYSDGLRKAFTINGKIYGFCWSVEYWPVWYNKEVFAKNNISVPKTWADFIKACDTLKAAGITPLNQTVDKEWPAFIWFEQLAAGIDPDLYEGICSGKIKYTDPKVKEVFTVWADMIAKGYFTEPSTDFFADMPRMFNDNKLAMILAGTWYYQSQLIDKGVSADKVGQFIVPVVKDSAGKIIVLEASPIMVSKNGENKEEAKKLADWWMSPEGNGVFAGEVKSFPANMKTDTSYLPPIKVELNKTIIKDKYRLVNRFWEYTPTPIMLKVNAKFAEFIVNPDKVDKLLTDMQAIADEYWSKNK